jgi:uncharacterized membrane protein
MPPPRPTLTDEQVEQILGNLLRAGVLLSALVVLAGGIVFLLRHGGAIPNWSTFQLKRTDGLRSPTEICHSAGQLGGRGLIQLGLLLLIGTPIARVIFSVFAFFRERDYIYVVFTLIVLGLLLFSLFSGTVS